MRKKGVEPIHPNREQEPESCASTNFATFAYEKQCKTTATTNRRRHALYPRTTPYASFFCLSALFAAFLARSMSLSLHTSFFGGRALCRYRSIRAFFWGRPIGKADTGRLQLRYCPQAANTLRYRPIACCNTGSWARSMSLSLHTSSGGALSAKPIRDACSYAIARKRPIRSAIALLPAAIRALGRALCRYRSIRARGAAQTAVAVVKNCCECEEWPLQSSSMDDCMTNAKKSSKEPPVVRLPSRSYSHALHIQAQAPSSL